MSKQLRWVAWLLPVVAVLVFILWRNPHWWSSHPEDRPECPHIWTDKDTANTNHLSIPGPIVNIPEYHDCQRFLVKNASGGLKYDSMEAIFVRYKLDSFYRSHGRRPDAPSNPSAAPTAPDFDPNGFEVVGQVLSYGDYAPLGIKTGSDCLVLRWTTVGERTSYAAWIVGVGENGHRCKNDAPIDLIKDQNAVPLNVALVRTVGEIPPVSRWDWDSKDSLQYIGIACPTGWCEIHAPGAFRSSPTYSESHEPISKGFYDEQYLATYVSGSLVHDDSTFGTIYPDPRLAKQTMVSYTSWQPVAWVALSSASDAYRNKLNFDRASPLNVPLSDLTNREVSAQLNEVELCFVPTGQTGCVADGGAPLPTNCPTDYTNNGTWYARESPPEKSARASMVTCTEFRSYPPPQAPPVVRWRWQNDDESMWISCPTGCCHVKARL